MPHYHVRFMKTVCDSTGHEHYICQYEADIAADCKDAAVTEAKARFCRHKQTRHWSTHAEALEIERLPDPEAAREEAMRDAWAFLG